jgi:UDPglucose 6-dehydrogenase
MLDGSPDEAKGMKDPAISVVGLGKLGTPMAACLAARGLRVIGADADALKVGAIERGQAPVFEPGLQRLIQAAQGRLSATDSIMRAVLASQITFIVVATPSEPDGGFSLRHVLPACEHIGQALQVKEDFHLVVLTSTVMPGTTEGPVRNTLEQASGKLAGRDFGLCYGPEFIALGTVIRDFLNPDFVLIGESDPRSGAMLEALYQEVCENAPPTARMSLVSAEVAKLAVNTYVTTKISFANMLARICERLPGADVDAVTNALGMDSRIGPKYLKGAISYGGPCFPRDNLALAALARRVGAPADIAEVTDDFNRAQIRWLADVASAHCDGERAVGILGLTYKPNTDVVEEATGLLLAQELISRGVKVIAYDPAGNRKAQTVLEGMARLAACAEECVQNAKVVVVTTPWPEFIHLRPEIWSGNRHNGSTVRVVIDCWNVLGQLRDCDGIRHVRLGCAIESQLEPTPRALRHLPTGGEGRSPHRGSTADIRKRAALALLAINDDD